MARCHRIGQEKEVTVYRLISKDTYEEQVFSTASRKFGECGSVGCGGSVEWSVSTAARSAV
jgi:hypothetical protein